MAARQLKATRFAIPLDERGDTRSDVRNAPALAQRFTPDQALTRFDFRAPADRTAERRRAIGILGLATIAAAGAFAALSSFAGIIPAAVAATAVAALIGFGNWVLNHIIDV